MSKEKNRPMVVRPPGLSTGSVAGPLREEKRGGFARLKVQFIPFNSL